MTATRKISTMMESWFCGYITMEEKLPRKRCLKMERLFAAGINEP
jgi:hypothetical protein